MLAWLVYTVCVVTLAACITGCRFCQSLRKELDGLIEDVSHYIQPREATLTLTPTLSGYIFKVGIVSLEGGGREEGRKEGEGEGQLWGVWRCSEGGG